MILDGLCEVHGEPKKMYFRKSGPQAGQPVLFCASCRRNRRGQRAQSSPRCRYGHLKTPWTWRSYGNGHRCLTCQYERRAARRLQRREAAA